MIVDALLSLLGLAELFVPEGRTPRHGKFRRFLRAVGWVLLCILLAAGFLALALWITPDDRRGWSQTGTLFTIGGALILSVIILLGVRHLVHALYRR